MRAACFALLAALAGCGAVVDGDGRLSPDEVRQVSTLVGSGIVIGRIASGGAPILRDDQGKGSLICNMLSDPANADTILAMLATNGGCDVYTLSTADFPLPEPKPEAPATN